MWSVEARFPGVGVKISESYVRKLNEIVAGDYVQSEWSGGKVTASIGYKTGTFLGLGAYSEVNIGMNSTELGLYTSQNQMSVMFDKNGIELGYSQETLNGTNLNFSLRLSNEAILGLAVAVAAVAVFTLAPLTAVTTAVATVATAVGGLFSFGQNLMPCLGW